MEPIQSNVNVVIQHYACVILVFHRSFLSGSQPYVNINGQLHRAPSRDYTDFARPNPLRSSRDRLTPEPEIPPREWEPRRLEHDERPATEVNYVSHLV